MVFNTNSLKGKNIAITGATKGIGRATAMLLSSLGANLLLGARDVIHLQDLTSSFSGSQSNVIVQYLNVEEEKSIMEFLNLGLSKLGKIDALVNCAGYGLFNSFLDLTTEEFDRMISVNLRGSFLTSKHFANHMVRNKRGQIININSIAGNIVLEGNSGYSASKFGLLGLTKVMQLELRKQGVFVTSILPGSTNTSFWDHIDNHPDKSKMIPQEVIAMNIASVLCQPEGAVVEEITITPPLGVL
ncbi:SDR family oxidoreductase [Ureibacillus chungkukjangi]|uniref:SDR family oxidoreductase n=1 Tax=Ureibacillus chungkukjangi TaxID=1202712 RepID=UPI00203BF349|nr:SDR family oxidoreductase [Ureibacillus chungkukjangi]MCM3390382.1 SDR family oxidoreductase [Ureibacillus chungkukjangi]